MGLIGHLKAGARRLPSVTDSTIQGLRDASDSMSRLQHLFPPRQAFPLVAPDLRRMTASPETRHRDVLAACMWGAAARWDDVQGVWPSDLTFPCLNVVRMRYRKTKTAQKGAIRLVEFLIPPLQWHRLRHLARATPHQQKVFTISESAMRYWVKKYEPRASLHSFRRGAIQAALRDPTVDERWVQRLSGHKTLQSLLGYAADIGQRARRQMMAASSAMWAAPLSPPLPRSVQRA
jgi:integrase